MLSKKSGLLGIIALLLGISAQGMEDMGIIDEKPAEPMEIIKFKKEKKNASSHNATLLNNIIKKYSTKELIEDINRSSIISLIPLKKDKFISSLVTYGQQINLSHMDDDITPVLPQPEPLTPAEFYDRYGRNIALCIDEHGAELNSTESDYIAVSHALHSILKSKVSIVLTTIDTWQKLKSVYRPEQSLLDSWDIYKKNDSHVLVFVPKILQSQATAKNTAIGIDLTDFHAIASSDFFSIDSSKKTTEKLTGALLSAFKNIMIPQSEDLNTRPWALWAIGHGGGYDICGWNEILFDMFLEHLRILKIKIFVYVTCHGGSRRVLVDFYANKRYDFPIAYPGLFDSTTLSSSTPDHKGFFRRLNTVTSFNNAHELDEIRYALNYITADRFVNTLRVRKAGSTKFELVPDNETVIVGLSNLPKFIDSYYCVYLLDRPVFTESLTFDRITSIITSALPGQVNHYMRHVRMPHVKDGRDLFRAFMKAQSKDKRLYMIDLFEGHGSLKLENVVVVNNHELPFTENSVRAVQSKHRLFHPYKENVISVSLENDDEPFKDKMGYEQEFRIYNIYTPARYRDFYIQTKAALLKNPEYRPEPAKIEAITEITPLARPTTGQTLKVLLTAGAVSAAAGAVLGIAMGRQGVFGKQTV